MEETPERVLVVTPHPDEAEFWCGGTVARWISQGATVRYILCTDGGKGSDQPGVTSQDLAATREGDQLEAAQFMGVQDVIMLHHPDGSTDQIQLRHSFTAEQIEWFKAGSALNLVGQNGS